MDIGIGLPNTVPGTEGRTLLDWARNAEEAGFSTLGTIGRLVYPNYEELIALSAAAAVTSRIRLTTSVLLAPLYANTALFAKQAASLDRLSGGRLVLGLGLGGRDDDYTASALPTTGKGRRFDQQLTEMKRIWAGESYGYAGAIGPEPVRPGGPELIIGGAAEASFRRVALLGDGWFMGGGYEYNLNWMPFPGLFWKTEYRFADYDKDSLALTVYGTGAATTRTIDSAKHVQTIRSELVWRFNWR